MVMLQVACKERLETMQPILKMFDRRAFILAEDIAMKVVTGVGGRGRVKVATGVGGRGRVKVVTSVGVGTQHADANSTLLCGTTCLEWVLR